MKSILAFVIKDIKNEIRAKELLFSMVTFSLLVIAIFNFSFPLSREMVDVTIPSFLWISFVLAGILGLSRSFNLEKENDAIKGVLLTPINPSYIYISKFISNTIFLLVLEIILIPLFVIFFNYDLWNNLKSLSFVLIGGTVGFSAVGTLFSTMAINTKLREVILPILVFPIIIPLLINVVKVTSVILRDEPIHDVWYSVKLILVFDVIFFVTGAVVYEFVLEDD